LPVVRCDHALRVLMSRGPPYPGELMSTDHPGPLGTETFTYDTLSRVKTHTDGKGQTIYDYDPLDRVKKITFQGGANVASTLSTATATSPAASTPSRERRATPTTSSTGSPDNPS
jgi:YD repeat-containing protein